MFLSVFNWSGVDFVGTARFVGFENFQSFLFGGNPIRTQWFWNALWNNFLIAIFSTLLVVPIALVLAFVVMNIKRGSGIYRTIYFIPMIAAGAGIFYSWQGLFEPRGSVNAILSAIGLDFLVVQHGIFGDPRTALSGVIVTVIWGAIPLTVMLYYAGLSSIDKTLYEAAAVDGASRFRILLSITWPLLKPMTVIIIITRINAAFQMFENVWILTRGGPGRATEVVGSLLYVTAFQDRAYGMASAMGWSVFVITLVLSILSMRSFASDK
jgi:ABC-type sugar transport system permease subunit